VKSRSRKRAAPAAVSASLTADTGEPSAHAGLSVVALGASAGGLEAMQQFLRNMPADSGAAIVVVSHLDPDHASLLAEILQRVTEIPVVEATDGMALAADHVYVMLPDREMALSGGLLRVTKPELPRGQRMPIDHFFRSVAQDCAARAIGVVLSGTGSDGALGLQAILSAGGVGLVQDPATAKFDGMPASAIAASPDARVMAPERMPEAVLAVIPEATAVSAGVTPNPAHVAGLRRVLAALRNRTGNDFSQYKMTTIGRRVARRMAEHGIADTATYARLVEEKAEEAQALLDEVLINVTSFFRDPVAFDVLKADVLPAVLAELPDDAVFRVWVAGCSTGEEAYSLAIVLRELIEEKHRTVDVQIFATDIDESAIAIARGATYPKSIAADVGAERLRRFFFEEGTEYRVAKSIREMVVFAVQNMVRDPAFTRLDLLSCRNVLIYLEAPLQDRLTATFHYALKPGGILFLSPSESVGGDGELFRPVDRRWKIYRPIRRPTPARVTAWSLPTLLPMSTPDAPVAARVKGPATNHAELTRRALLQAFAPPSVLTDAAGNILFVHGDTGRCLRPAPGQATFNVIEMAREELQTELRMAFSASAADGETPRVVDVSMDAGDGPVFVQLGVRRIADGGGRPLMLVTFAEVAGAPRRKRRRTVGKSSDAERIESLERRIAYTSENLHATIEEKQAAIEELQSTNEEMQSTSEEMQSTNEELETSKEELQSLNEEMSTVNAELEAKIEDLMDIQNDLKNLMDNVTVGTIFLDRHLAIRRFTRESERIYRLVPSDVGRPLSDFHADVDEDLLDDARTVLATLVPRARDVRTRSGDWFMARIQPYRTIENMIDGVVLTFTDISGRVKAEAALRASGALAEAIVNSVREPLAVLDCVFQVVTASPAFAHLVGERRDALVGRSLFALGGGAWDQPALRRALEDVLPKEETFEDLRIPYPGDGGDPGVLVLNGRRLENGASGGPMILLAVESCSPPGDPGGKS
jgi:two-component system, chemotaxis family, CheB/CheR fusion protein